MKIKIILLLLLMSFSSISSQSKPMKLIKPDYLKVGDTIAIVAPAGVLSNRQLVIDKAKKLAESWGLVVVYGDNLFNDNNHFSGTDKERVSDFQKALDNSKIKAIWAARGGYGSVRILDALNFTKFKKSPKWIIGYSDITAIHSHVHNLGYETIHAIMGTSLEDDIINIAASVSTFKEALFGEKLTYEIKSSSYNNIGDAKGQLIGGNLTLLLTTLGSKTQLNTDGKILFFEEIGEYKYHIDRMLQSLKRAGYFDNLKGIIVGDMSKMKVNSTDWGTSIEQLILDVVPNNIPILFNFPAGHEKDNRALILGREITLKVGKEKSEVIFKD